MRKFTIDCGHGGIDKDGNYTTAPSKMAKVNGDWVYEGVINRTIGGVFGALLEWRGYSHQDTKVKFTVHPNDSRDLSLQYRVRIANEDPTYDLISIHCNAFNGNARGFEIWTSLGDTESDILAQNIFLAVKPVAEKWGLPMRFDTSDGDYDKESDFYVLRKTKGRAVLVECIFFDNEEDLELIKTKEFFDEFIAALYHGSLKEI